MWLSWHNGLRTTINCNCTSKFDIEKSISTTPLKWIWPLAREQILWKIAAPPGQHQQTKKGKLKAVQASSSASGHCGGSRDSQFVRVAVWDGGRRAPRPAAPPGTRPCPSAAAPRWNSWRSRQPKLRPQHPCPTSASTSFLPPTWPPCRTTRPTDTFGRTPAGFHIGGRPRYSPADKPGAPVRPASRSTESRWVGEAAAADLTVGSSSWRPQRL